MKIRYKYRYKKLQIICYIEYIIFFYKILKYRYTKWYLEIMINYCLDNTYYFIYI